METKKRGSKKAVILVIVIAAIAAAAIFLAWKFLGKKEEVAAGDKAYVDTVANWVGDGNALGTINRFAGVVESQETWSVNQNPDATVDEILVQTGQEVKAGDPLFTYDIDQYQATLDQSQIDLERLQNELSSIQATIEQLKKDEQKASSTEKADYTIRIQEQELALKQKELEIKAKQQEIDKTKSNMANATVVSEIDGVVKSINKGTSTDFGGGSGDSGFITVMKTGDLRIKGTVNEQNMMYVSIGSPVIVHSRADDSTWSGTISKIDTENSQSGQGEYYGGDMGTSSSKYPFYVELEDSTGLMMGQHVYIEPDWGQGEIKKKEGLWLDGYLIDLTDPEAPFVWADDGRGKLEKRALTLGDYDEMMDQYQIVSGLTLEDAIAIPGGDFTEGMPTGTMEEYYEAMESGAFDEMYEDAGGMEEGMIDEGVIEEGVIEEGAVEVIEPGRGEPEAEEVATSGGSGEGEA